MISTFGSPQDSFEMLNTPGYPYNGRPVGSVGIDEAYDDAGDPDMFEDFFGGVESPDYFRGNSDEAIEVNPEAAPGAAYVWYGELCRVDDEAETETADVWPPEANTLAVMPVPGRRNNGFGGRGKTIRPEADMPTPHPIRDAYQAIDHTKAERLRQLAKGKYERVDEEGTFHGRYGWFSAEERAALAGTIQAEADEQRARVLPSQPFARGFGTRPTPLELAQAEAIMREKRQESRRKAAAAAIAEAMGDVGDSEWTLNPYPPKKIRVTDY